MALIILGLLFLVGWGVAVFIFHVAGFLIHILLLVAVVFFIVRLLQG